MTTGLELATPAVFGELAHRGSHWRSMLGWIRAAAELLTLLALRNSQFRAALTQHREIQPRQDSTTRKWVVMGQWLTVSRVSTVQIDHC
jgi:hypothetical protein